MPDLSHYFQELIARKRNKRGDRLLLGVLRLLSYPYAGVLSLRALAYRFGLLRSYRLPRPVVSVGNLTLGGTGKTPMVAYLADRLIASGKRVVVLSRGYGGSAGKGPCLVSDGRSILEPAEVAGDEPLLLARKVPGLMVVVGSDRYRGARFAMEDLDPDVFILDDGYQHLRLKRDLDILLLDAKNPFANGCTLPGGFLREPVFAARRADLVLYTRSGSVETPLAPLFGKPTCRSDHRIAGLAPLEGGDRVEFSLLKDRRVTAFSGIADPAAFFDLLEREGVRLTATISFADHARYGEEEIAAICRVRDASRSTHLITTEKDAVKLAPHAQKLGLTLVTLLEIRFEESTPLDAALQKILY